MTTFADLGLRPELLQAVSLRHALEMAQEAGLTARVIGRQGIVLEEIANEVQEGAYDMFCMGSSYCATTLRQYYGPNVTAEIADFVRCPLLIARYRPR